MDVLIIHLSPQPKIWRVWNSTCLKNPSKETKKKPEKRCLDEESYSVEMRRGDALFIRRGSVHHAYVDEGKGGGDGDSRNNNEKGGMPKVIEGSSVHVTFGFVVEREESVIGWMEKVLEKKVCDNFPEGVGLQDYINASEEDCFKVKEEVERVCGGVWEVDWKGGEESRKEKREREAREEEKRKEEDVRRRVMINMENVESDDEL